MTRITVIANIKVHEGEQGNIRPAFARLISATRNESGCIRYDLHQNNDDVTDFCFYEIWETKEDLQNHLASPHIQAFRRDAADMILSVNVSELTALEF